MQTPHAMGYSWEHRLTHPDAGLDGTVQIWSRHSGSGWNPGSAEDKMGLSHGRMKGDGPWKLRGLIPQK